LGGGKFGKSQDPKKKLDTRFGGEVTLSEKGRGMPEKKLRINKRRSVFIVRFRPLTRRRVEKDQDTQKGKGD